MEGESEWSRITRSLSFIRLDRMPFLIIPMDNLELINRVQSLEQSVFDLGREIALLRRKSDEASFEGFIKHQSIEKFHPCLEQQRLCENIDDPNNIMSFTPTTSTMFNGTHLRPALFAIREIKTHIDADIVDVMGVVESRTRVDIEVQFQTVEAEQYFSGKFKRGTTKIAPKVYHTFVHVANPVLFVTFLMKKYVDTIACWNSLHGTD